jgi:hypothetical protein
LRGPFTLIKKTGRMATTSVESFWPAPLEQ